MKTVFISYSWDSEDHQAWVIRLSDKLKERGVRVLLDVDDLIAGEDRFQFMEEAVSRADCTLVICTAEYVRKALNRVNGVGAETQLITPEFFERHQNGKRFIPVVREHSPDGNAVPRYLSGLFYADFTGLGLEDERRVEKLVQSIYSQSSLLQRIKSDRDSEYVSLHEEIEKSTEWHPRRHMILSSAIEILRSPHFPKQMSIDGHISENPIFVGDVAELVGKWMPKDSSEGPPLRIMPMDIYLIKAQDRRGQPLLLQYYSGNPSTGWHSWLFPHGYHMLHKGRENRMSKNARDLEVDLGLNEGAIDIDLSDGENFAVSVKPDFGYKDSLVIYIFTFCYCRIRGRNPDLRKGEFQVQKGHYRKEFRWSHLEDLRGDPVVYSKNGDILKAIHSVWHNSLAAVPWSLVAGRKLISD